VELAGRLERHPEPQALAGRVLALLFFNPSLRTLASFQSGMARLGGSSFVISPGQGSWLLETRDGVVMDGAAAEHVREAIPVLAGYADALGIRSFAGGTDLVGRPRRRRLRRHGRRSARCRCSTSSRRSTTPARRSPTGRRSTTSACRRRHGRFVLSWAWHPKPLPLAVPAAAVHMAALRGMEVTVLRPEGYALPEPVMERARQAAAERSGGSCRRDRRPPQAMAGAHVLYAKSWAPPAATATQRG
jgi:N-acetylornithine carbamoyltransferase